AGCSATTRTWKRCSSGCWPKPTGRRGGPRMGDAPSRPARPELLHYRAWRGPLRGAEAEARRGPVEALVGALLRPWQTAWPIARVSLGVMFRRKLFWALYALALLVFLFFFFGQYLMAWSQTQLGESDVRVGGFGRANPRALVQMFRVALKLDGSGETHRNFFWYEGYMVMVVLALAGS